MSRAGTNSVFVQQPLPGLDADDRFAHRDGADFTLDDKVLDIQDDDPGQPGFVLTER